MWRIWEISGIWMLMLSVVKLKNSSANVKKRRKIKYNLFHKSWLSVITGSEYIKRAFKLSFHSAIEYSTSDFFTRSWWHEKTIEKFYWFFFACLASEATKSILIKFKKIFMKRLQISRRDLDIYKRGMPVRFPHDLQSLMCLKQKLSDRSQLLIKHCWMQNRNISSTHIRVKT